MTHLEIVKKLIGPISPVGKSEVDSERLENLKAFCSLVNEMVTEIDSVSYNYGHSHEHSVKVMANYAETFLSKTLGISDK